MTLIYEAPRDPSQPLKVRGVGRVADEPRSVLVALSERPTDDEIRAIHKAARSAVVRLTDEEIVEAMAKAVWESLDPGAWEKAPESGRNVTRAEQRSALAAYRQITSLA